MQERDYAGNLHLGQYRFTIYMNNFVRFYKKFDYLLNFC